MSSLNALALSFLHPHPLSRKQLPRILGAGRALQRTHGLLVHSPCPCYLGVKENETYGEQTTLESNDRSEWDRLAALTTLASTVMPSNTPSVRVVVRLPWDRSENAEPDPPRVCNAYFPISLTNKFISSDRMDTGKG